MVRPQRLTRILDALGVSQQHLHERSFAPHNPRCIMAMMPREEQIYVIDAEITFDAPVSRDMQEVAKFAVGALVTPIHLSPTLRWVIPRRAVVGDLAISAPSSASAIEAARDLLREYVEQNTTLSVRSVAILSIKLRAP
jgi:hypothetical protein